MRLGGKRGWNRKARRGNKDFKKGGGKLGQRVGALNRGDWNPLTNYEYQEVKRKYM